MTDERNTSAAEQERRIREAIRSTGEVRADAAFRERLKREFVEGTISEPAAARKEPRAGGLARWWWVLVPAAVAVLLIVLLLPKPAPTWTVLALRGEGQIEIDGQTVAAGGLELMTQLLGAGGRVRVPEGFSLDLRLDDRLVVELDEGADVTLPVPSARGAAGPLISEVHHGELRIKTGPGFPGTTLHILTAEGRTELVGTIVSVYRGDGYTCVCVLEGTAQVGEDEATLEDVRAGMLKIMFEDGSPPFLSDISPDHEEGLIEFNDRLGDVFNPKP